MRSICLMLYVLMLIYVCSGWNSNQDLIKTVRNEPDRMRPDNHFPSPCSSEKCQTKYEKGKNKFYKPKYHYQTTHPQIVPPIKTTPNPLYAPVLSFYRPRPPIWIPVPIYYPRMVPQPPRRDPVIRQILLAYLLTKILDSGSDDSDDCGEWSQWSPCSVTCRSGSSSRTRVCESALDQTTEIRDCGQECSAWTTWSQCSTSCQQGTRSSVQDCGNVNCYATRSEPCNVGLCTWGDWSQWNPLECNGRGDEEISRTRTACAMDVCARTDTETVDCE